MSKYDPCFDCPVMEEWYNGDWYCREDACGGCCFWEYNDEEDDEW